MYVETTLEPTTSLLSVSTLREKTGTHALQIKFNGVWPLTSVNREDSLVKLQILSFIVEVKSKELRILKANHCRLPLPLLSDRMKR